MNIQHVIDFPTRLWFEASHTALYLGVRLFLSAIENIDPIAKNAKYTVFLRAVNGWTALFLCLGTYHRRQEDIFK